MDAVKLARLHKQIDFIVEIDKLKQIYRQNFVTVGDRHETDAEHSWHMAMMAMLLYEHVDEQPVDVLKVMKMVLIHDIVEIDAGDTYCFDKQAGLDKAERENRAAERLFNLLPSDQAQEFRSLWDEFEAVESLEARFAAALDRLQPLLLHYHTDGKSWKMHGITRDKVVQRNKRTQEISESLGKLVAEIIEDSVRKQYLQEK